VEIISGLTTMDAVIDNPPDSLESGDRVHAARTDAEKPDGARGEAARRFFIGAVAHATSWV